MNRPMRKPVTLLSAAALLTLAASGSVQAVRAQDRIDDATADHQTTDQGLSGPAVLAVVSIRKQTVALYDADGGSVRARVSSGRREYETPVGVYSILQKKEEHYSNLYDDAAMPFMQRITWSGIALHAGELPGRPASHGCVRMPYSFAQEIFPQTKMGMRVVVSREDVAPVPIAHPRLPKPDPIDGQALRVPEQGFATQAAYDPEADASESGNSPLEADVRRWPARQAQLEGYRTIAFAKAAEAEIAAEHAEARNQVLKEKASDEAKAKRAERRADGAKRSADQMLDRAERRLALAKQEATIKSREQQRDKAAAAVVAADAKLAEAKAELQAAEQAHARVKEAQAAADAAKTAAEEAAKEAKRKTYPVSIFISLKAQRLYVRQGHQPVLDVPVTITDPETPIGTHVYTAVDYKDETASDVRWNVVSIGDHAPADVDSGARDRDNRRRSSKGTGEPTPTDAAAALAALDRITIPDEVLARVSAYVWPGSSLIVSDEEASRETGKATDFVVLISGEPQGGIKKRPRRPKPDEYDRYYDSYYYDYYERPRRSRRYNPPFFSFW